MYSGNFWTDFSLNNVWISYNLGLALIPFVLAQVLFNKKRNFSFLWIVGFILFILFLPNAPYVFTDLIHLPKALFAFNSKKAEFVITGQFFVLISFGFYFFNESYRKFENFIINKRLFKNRLLIRLGTFTLMSLGVFLGRFLRFNSWDFFIHPFRLFRSILLMPHFSSVSFILLFTLLLVILYEVFDKLKTEKILEN